MAGGPRSLLDGADLAALRLAGFEGGPAALVLACLLDSGAVQFDAADPEWPDRDRLLIDPSLPLKPVAAVLQRCGYPVDESRLGQGPGRVMADAVRAAELSKAAGEIYRVFVLLDALSLAVGGVWEGLVAAGAHGLPALCALILHGPGGGALGGSGGGGFGGVGAFGGPGGGLPDPVAVARAAGWRVDRVGADPADVLGGLDRVLAAVDRGEAGPSAVVVRSGA